MTTKQTESNSIHEAGRNNGSTSSVLKPWEKPEIVVERIANTAGEKGGLTPDSSIAAS